MTNHKRSKKRNREEYESDIKDVSILFRLIKQLKSNKKRKYNKIVIDLTKEIIDLS